MQFQKECACPDLFPSLPKVRFKSWRSLSASGSGAVDYVCMDRTMDRLINNQDIHRWPCLKISTLSISTSPVTVQLSFMLSDYCPMLFWWVLFVTLVFDGVRPLDGQEH
jgi:hypothetical protein